MNKPSILKLLLLFLIFITITVFSAIIGMTMLKLMMPSITRPFLLLFAIVIILVMANFIRKEFLGG